MTVAILGGLGFFLLAHIAWWRLKPSDDPRILGLAALGGIGMVVSVVLLYRQIPVEPVALVFLISVQLFAVILYLFFYAGIARSVSVMVLIQLRQAGGSLPLSDFEREAAQFDRRMEQLLAAGWLRAVGSSVELTKKGRRMAQLGKVLSGLLAEKMEG